MNNDLEQFSENMLEKMAVGDIYPTVLEQAALARIALSANQAKPVCFIGKQMLIDLTEENRSCGRVWLAARDEVDGNDRIPLYTTPQPAHTEQDGCQWNSDEDSVYSTGCGKEWQFTEGGIEDNKITFCPYCSGKIAAPKPESE